MKKKNLKVEHTHDRLFIVLLIIFFLTTISLVVVIMTHRDKEIEISPQIDEIYNYFTTDDLNNCHGLFQYSDSLVEYESIDSDILLCVAYHKTEITGEKEVLKVSKKKTTCKKDNMIFRADDGKKECTINKIDRSLIDSTYKKIFGKDVVYTDKFMIDGMNNCYLNNDYYYCGLSEEFTYILNGSSVYRIIDKYEEKSSNEIVIYDYFIKVNDTLCYSNYVKNTINTKCSDKYNKNNKINYQFMKKYGTSFKHVFKLAEDNTYYWVSSEPIK